MTDSFCNGCRVASILRNQLRKPRVGTHAFDKPDIVERNNDPLRSMSVGFPADNQPVDYLGDYGSAANCTP
ncbi:MAG: hypothetical protein ABI270_05785 [Nitrosospira sp.]